ncbi:hypothetical protein JV59_24350 (plasmid) [Vibrio coralliilyticus]|nr:hypothetical protein JV59_24350 [Vibrio coralliilyticus]
MIRGMQGSATRGTLIIAGSLPFHQGTRDGREQAREESVDACVLTFVRRRETLILVKCHFFTMTAEGFGFLRTVYLNQCNELQTVGAPLMPIQPGERCFCRVRETKAKGRHTY